ncbi:cytochrome c-type biogenesis protein CcmH [Photobacterium sanctipauli]|uniref:Cytochrome c-type biogenesis protein n=1 Tax=Photobacterium sanctipauli TaxID=1342794 RepID=A0A2T3NTG6_9GAMM|nr:cytochrome c-type biogenesis protein [Photobacterium sanctipauli]PSW19511.1 cytochrome c-type biogenesis protein CcmH [Photobacterium sanctipauli]
MSKLSRRFSRLLLAPLLALGVVVGGVGVTAISAMPAVAAIDVYDFDSAEKEKAFRELTMTLRCPKCQNNNIADSNAELAQDMRQKAYDMLSEGKSKQDVVDYMIARYGNFVTYNPPIMASTIILWAAPVIFIVIGFTVLVMRSRKPSEATSSNEELEVDEQARLKELMAEMDKQDSSSNQSGKVK